MTQTSYTCQGTLVQRELLLVDWWKTFKCSPKYHPTTEQLFPMETPSSVERHPCCREHGMKSSCKPVIQGPDRQGSSGTQMTSLISNCSNNNSQNSYIHSVIVHRRLGISPKGNKITPGQYDAVIGQVPVTSTSSSCNKGWGQQPNLLGQESWTGVPRRMWHTVYRERWVDTAQHNQQPSTDTDTLESFPWLKAVMEIFSSWTVFSSLQDTLVELNYFIRD